MEEHGKKFDILFEDVILTDPQTGITRSEDHHYTLWADEGLEKLIEGVEGVRGAYYILGRYSVYMDKRYDGPFVCREIEAAILCRPADSR